MTSTPRLAPTRYALTDCGNAERLRDAHGDSIRFCPEQKQWYAWGGARWVPDRGLVVQLARKTIRSIPVERAWLLEKLKDDQLDVGQMRREADALANWARLSEGAARIRAMLEMAKTEPSLTATPGGFDQDPWLLNLTNGTLELKSGRCRVHRSQDRMTKMANAEYQPEASCPSWMRFLGQVFAPHLDILPFIQRAVGYSLSGEPNEDCVFVLRGAGRNGKSTFITLLDDLLGDYAGCMEMDTLLDMRRSGPQEDIADLRGRRFISAQEPRANGRFDSALLKWLTGGDIVRSRKLYGHSIEFKPEHKIWLCVNRIPTLPADDPALWSRINIIPFDVSFLGREDRQLKSILLTERSGILNWAIQGCKDWRKSGLARPASVREATEHCRSSNSRHGLLEKNTRFRVAGR